MRDRHGLLVAGLCLVCSVSCGAQKVDVPVKEAPVENVSRTQFTTKVQHLQQIAVSCKLASGGCGADVGPDDEVAAEGSHGAFLERWDWLRDVLEAAPKQKQNERSDAMSLAIDHLNELAVEIGSPGTEADTAGSERTANKAREVLQRPEFRPVAAGQPSWLDRKNAQFWMWFGGLFEGARRLGAALPWLGKVLEWGFFLFAAVGLLLLIRRVFARQQLQIALSSGVAQFSAWERESNDWASEAEARAAKGEWRDAVHCLYWAAIVRLEANRAWRHNPSRTPREYVRLLQQGSAQQSALRGLTAIFERVWYGLREAQWHDYERAKSLFTELSHGTPRSLATAGEG